MPISFNCPACDHHLDAPDAAAGRSGDCRFCHARIIAPAQSGHPATLADAPQASPLVNPVGSSPPHADVAYPATGEHFAPPTKPAKRLPAAMMYGDLAKRLIACIVDNMILGLATDLLVTLLIAPLVGRDGGVVASNPKIVWPAFLIIEWLYFTLMESSPTQATFGKVLLGLKVADTWGEPLTFWRAGARCAAKWLSQNTFFIGYLMAMFNNRSQTLHDLIAGTVVIER